MRKEIEEVKTGIADLHRKGIIHYEPKKETPHIRFLQNRVKAEDLYIDAVAYLKRKAAFEKRVKAMMSYMVDAAAGHNISAGILGMNRLLPVVFATIAWRIKKQLCHQKDPVDCC